MNEIRVKSRSGAPAETGRDFLKSLAQTVKMTSLYGRKHPVPAASGGETIHILRRLCKANGREEVCVSLKDGRWIVDGEAFEFPQVPGKLDEFFRGWKIENVVFRGSVQQHEFDAFCSLLAASEIERGSLNPVEFLKVNGAIMNSMLTC